MNNANDNATKTPEQIEAELDAEFDAQTDRVSSAIQSHLASLRCEARELDLQAAAVRKEADRIEAAVRAGRFYELTGVLSKDDIADLSMCHLTDTSAYLGDND